MDQKAPVLSLRLAHLLKRYFRLSLGLALACLSTANADTFTWNGRFGSSNNGWGYSQLDFNTGLSRSNWTVNGSNSGTNIPNADDSVIINDTGGVNSINLNGNQSIMAMTFSRSQSFIINEGNVVNSTLTLLNGNLTVSGGANLFILGGLNQAADGIWNLSNGNLEVDKDIQGAGRIEKRGGSTLKFRQTSTVATPLLITTGMVEVGVSANVVTLNGGTISSSGTNNPLTVNQLFGNGLADAIGSSTNVTIAQVISPGGDGTIGTITIGNNGVLNGTFRCDIDGSNADFIDVDSNDSVSLTLSGATLEVNQITPTFGEVIIAEADSFVGSFSSISEGYEVRVEDVPNTTPPRKQLVLVAPNRILVDADASGVVEDGATWATAYRTLNDGLSAANSALGSSGFSGEVWVAEGIYRPNDKNTTNLSQTQTFSMSPGIQLLGGFNATETLAEERNPLNNITVLSGDLGRDDNNVTAEGITPTPADLSGNNAFTIINYPSSSPGVSSLIHGFTMTAGNANSTNAFIGGNLKRGGAIFVQGSQADGDLVVERCRFFGNNAVQNGGAIATERGVGLIVRSCEFRANQCSARGGAIYYNRTSSTETENCHFSGNYSGLQGGAVYLDSLNNATSTFVNCTFSGNEVDTTNSNSAGTAIFADETVAARAVMHNTVIWADTVEGNGTTGNAADFNLLTAFTYRNSLIKNVDLSSVEASNLDGTDVINDPLFTTPITSPAPTLEGDLQPTSKSPLINRGDNSFLSNVTQDVVGADRVQDVTIDMGAYETRLIIEPIFVSFTASSPDSITVDLNAALPLVGGSNFNFTFSPNPSFASLSSIDAQGMVTFTRGTTTLGSSADFVFTADVGGAFSTILVTLSDTRNVIFVDETVSGGDGTSWAAAFDSLQDALAAASPGDEIWVANGRYLPAAAGNRSTPFTIPSNITLYGGFAGGEGNLSQRDLENNLSILSGDIDKNDINADGNRIAEVYTQARNNNSYTVVHFPSNVSNCVLDGFVITAGITRNETSGLSLEREGAGAYISTGASPTIRHCRFIGNSTASNSFGEGGGLYATGDSALITDCFFSGGSAIYGGGVANQTDSLTRYERCVIENNTGRTVAGGVSNTDAQPTFVSCMIRNNSSLFEGGGIFNDRSDATYINCLITGNDTTDGDHAGGVFNSNSSPQFINCTFSKNLGPAPRAMNGDNNSTPVLTNCLIWDDTMGQTNRTTFTNCLIQGFANGGLDGTDPNNDPLFLDAANGDFRVNPLSPVINVGNNAANPEATDIAGTQRIYDRIDLGAYETPSMTLSYLVGSNPTNTNDLRVLFIYGDSFALQSNSNSSFATLTLVESFGRIRINLHTPNVVDSTIVGFSGIVDGETVYGRVDIATFGDNFDLWASRNFPGETDANIIGFLADPNGRGVPNAIGFLTATTSSAPAQDTLPIVTEGANTIAYDFRRHDAADAFPSELEYSTDLNNWFTADSSVQGLTLSVDDDDFGIIDGQGVDRVRLEVDKSEFDQIFVRQKIYE